MINIIYRKELLFLQHQSTKIGRGMGQVSVLLVGSSGVGKSSTVNHLFDLDEKSSIHFAKTSSSISETRTTTEYVLRADEPEYEVKGLELGLVDSPGFNDTNGIRQDACNFLSIKEFYKKHPTIAGSFPNLIFVMVDANDKRIQGENSNLAKSLKCLMRLNLVDPKHPNVIGVMTHAYNLGRSPEKWTRAFEERKTLIKSILFKHLNVAAEVVALENDRDGLEVKHDFTVLPNDKTLQPKNLFNTCVRVLSDNGDLFGQLVLSRVFGQERNTPNPGFEVPAKDATKETLSSAEEEFVEFFVKTAKGGKLSTLKTIDYSID